MAYWCPNLGCGEVRQLPGPSWTCTFCSYPLCADHLCLDQHWPLDQTHLKLDRNPYDNLVPGDTTSVYTTATADPIFSPICGQLGRSIPSATYDNPSHQSPTGELCNAFENNSGSAYLRVREATVLPSARIPATSLAAISKAFLPGSSSKRAETLTKQNFEYYDPHAVKSSKGKTRSCVSCFRRNSSCVMATGEMSCQRCSSGDRYCKGTITLATGFTPQCWISHIVQCERAERASLDSIIDDSPLFNVRLKLGTESRTSSSLAPVELLEGCKLDLRSLRDERHHSNTGLSWEKLFDTIITAPEDVQQDGSISRMKSLASFERCCRHLAAALTYLGAPELCTIDFEESQSAAKPYIVLETLRQLAIQASSRLSEVFDTLNAYLNAPRNRATVRGEMCILGSGLGLCHRALSHFGAVFLNSVCSRSELAGLVAPSLLAQLATLGNTFDPTSFKESSRAEPLSPSGFHIASHSIKGHVLSSQPRVRQCTFIEVFPHRLDAPLSDRAQGSQSTSMDISQQTKQLGLKILQLQQEQKEVQKARKRLESQMTTHDKVATRPQCRLGPNDELSLNTSADELQSMTEPRPWFTTPTLFNPNLIKHNASFNLANPSDRHDSISLPYHLKHDSVSIAANPMTASTFQSLGDPVVQCATEQECISTRKRKRVSGICAPRNQSSKTSRNEDEARMTDETDDLPASPMTATTPASFMPLLKEAEPQAFPTHFFILPGAEKPRTEGNFAHHVDATLEPVITKADSKRPVSWPRTQRWRQSIGLSARSPREDIDEVPMPGNLS